MGHGWGSGAASKGLLAGAAPPVGYSKQLPSNLPSSPAQRIEIRIPLAAETTETSCINIAETGVIQLLLGAGQPGIACGDAQVQHPLLISSSHRDGKVWQRWG